MKTRIKTPKTKRVVITLQVALTTSFDDGAEVLAHSLMGEVLKSLTDVHKVSQPRGVYAKVFEPMVLPVTLAYGPGRKVLRVVGR
jgi:hypothetical protein